jgi:ribosomal-protein-alanine N-acetyltransferase
MYNGLYITGDAATTAADVVAKAGGVRMAVVSDFVMVARAHPRYCINAAVGDQMFTNIETNRLVLKCIDHSDRDFILEEFQNDFINRYLYDEEPMKDIFQADELIDFYTLAEPRNQNRWVLIEKTTNTKLGTCGFHLWNPGHKDVEIGFELMEQYNGRGYMLEAVEAIIDFARHKMKVEIINAMVFIENKNCIKLLEKLGFIKVGEEETEFRGHIYLHDKYSLKLQL